MIIASILTILFLLLSLYIAVFSVWRTFEREHIEDIPASIDKMAIALGLGWYLSRLPSIAELVLKGQFDVFTLLNPLQGTASWQVGISIFLLFFYILSRSLWKDVIALLDYIVVSLTVFLALYFFAQGIVTIVVDLVLGNALPLAFLARSLAGFFFFLGLGRFLSYLELQYRTFFWYRYRRSSAQTGFVLAVFCMGAGIFGVLGSFAFLPFPLVSVPMFEILWSLVLIVSGFLILFVRSGRLKRK